MFSQCTPAMPADVSLLGYVARHRYVDGSTSTEAAAAHMTYGSTPGSDDSAPHDPPDPGHSADLGLSEPSYLQGSPFGQPAGYGRGPAQAGPYGTDGPYGTSWGPAPDKPPQTYLTYAVLSLLFFWPASIVSIVFASQVKAKWARGDYQGAAVASKRAKTWAIVSLVVGVVAIVLLLVLDHGATTSSS
jgi:Interferon-induced transmembrane protein